LALFDTNVLNETKTQIVLAFAFKDPNPNNLKQHKSRIEHPPDCLSYFASKASMTFFDILKIVPTFLSKTPENWQDDESYQQINEAIDGLVVINDAAERAVALIKMFCRGRTKCEMQLQNLIQSVDESRKMHKSTNKSSLI
jgi:hypothetical protein